jgi:predicted negative regulator of RcsB-dependent stress response
MKLDKHEARRPDAFLQLSDKVGHWLSENRGPVLLLSGLALLVGVIYAAYSLYSTGHESKAQEALYQARKIYNPAVADPFGKVTAEPKLTDEAERAFHSVIEGFSGTQASKVAAIELSQAFLDEKKPDEALKVFDKVKTSSNDLVGTLLALQKAKVLEADSKCSDAVTLLEKIWNSKRALKAFQTEARLRAGLCYEQLSQLDKAKEMFKTAGEDKGAAADTARKYLRLIQPHEG